MSRQPAASDTFGASAQNDLATPMSGRDGQGGRTDQREGLEYVTCHLCEYPFSDPKRDGRRFWMMSCKHILCDDQKHGHRQGQCTVCHAMGVTAVPLGKSMPQDVESYFLSSEMIVQRTEDGNQKLHFWVQQLKKYISYQKNELRQRDMNFNELRRKLAIAEKANGRVSEVEGQNQILQQELARLKGELAFNQSDQPESHQPPARTSYRHIEPPSRSTSGISARPYSAIRTSANLRLVEAHPGYGYERPGTGGMAEITEEDEDQNQEYEEPQDRGQKRPRYEGRSAPGFLPPRNLNIPPPPVFADRPPNIAYVDQEQRSQDYRGQEQPLQADYEEQQVQPYHQPRVSMSVQKPRTNLQDFALDTGHTPSRALPPQHMRPPSVIPHHGENQANPTMMQRFSALPGRALSATPQPSSASRGPVPFRPSSVGGSRLNPNRSAGIQRI